MSQTPPARLPSLLLTAAAAVVTVLTLIRVVVYWSNQAYLDTVAGVWTAMAVDLADGVLYRPLSGPAGYGGTRYAPLHAILQAAVLAVTGDPVWSGQIVAAISVSLLVVAVYFVVRAMGGARLLAACSASSVLASQTTQHALLSIRGDALPAALNMLGLALCVRSTAGPHHALFAAGLFVLAVTSKPTALWGVIAATAWLACSGRPRRATLLVSTATLGIIGVIATLQLATQGRAFETMRLSATSAVGLTDLLMAPPKFAQIARQVPETLVFIQLGFAAALTSCVLARSVCNASALLFASVLLVSVPIFAFAGTDSNHLVDINAAAVVAVASLIVAMRDQKADFAIATLVVAMLAASLSLGSSILNRRSEQQRGTFAQTLALIPDRQRPILAENPLVPISAGQRPYMLDPFMFRILREGNPGFDEPLWRGLRQQAFSAVVLERNPHDARGVEWYKSAFFGAGFIEALEESYHETGRVGMRVVYTPKP